MQKKTLAKFFEETFPELFPNDQPKRQILKLSKTFSNNSIANLSPVTKALSPQSMLSSLNCLPFTSEEWSKLFLSSSPDSINKERLLTSLKAGISNQIRGKVWMLLSKSFSLSLSYAKSYYDNLLKESNLEAESLIHKDVPRTFLYKTSDKLIDIQSQSTKLFNILKAFSVFDREISYCQGMNSLAATLLQLIGNESYCFWTFVSIMHQNKWREFYKKNTPKLFRMLEILKEKLRKAMPQLYQHFIDVNFEQYLDMIFSHFFITLFTYNCPFEFSIRVIDLFWVYEEKALFDCIIKLLLLKKDKLLEMPFEELVVFLKNDIVFEVVDDVDINTIILSEI